MKTPFQKPIVDGVSCRLGFKDFRICVEMPSFSYIEILHVSLSQEVEKVKVYMFCHLVPHKRSLLGTVVFPLKLEKQDHLLKKSVNFLLK